MKKCKTPSYNVEIQLEPLASDVRRFNDRMRCATRLTNVMTQHARDVIDRMRSDPRWVEGRKLPVQKRAAHYKALRQEFGFASDAFDAVVAKHAHAAGFTGRIGSQEYQALATKVFKAHEAWVLGARGRPRFKGRQRPVHSVEGKTNTSMLQWKPELGMLQMQSGWWVKVQLPDLKKDAWLATALQDRTKYCRLVWRTVRGERRWFVQLVQEGQTPMKTRVLEKLAAPGAVGGLDLGPSTVAWCTGTNADKVPLFQSLARNEREIRVLQRKIDRQRRANNPERFRANGTVKRGGKLPPWTTSARQRRSEARLANIQRVEAADRKASHRAYINFLLTQALHWRDDGVAPRALQARYGKSVGKRAPGMFMEMLTRKAERAGGSRTIIDSWALKTSQYDHSTNDFVKKPLSERWHSFRDGRGRVQRDVYSAFLARNAEANTHHPLELETAWAALTSRLSTAGWYQSVKTPEETGTARTRASRGHRGVSPASLTPGRSERLLVQQTKPRPGLGTPAL